MIFDGRPTRDITVDELRQLVADHVAEDRHLDYKERPYDQRDPNALYELLKDITAFANADGGYLIIGIQEDGARRAMSFVNVENDEAVRRSIIDRCLAHIEPRPRGLDIAAFGVEGNTIVVIHVPEADRKPLCARPNAEHHYFWRRYEDGNKLMSTAEIRECFEGDRVHRELAGLRRELAQHAQEHVVSRESEMEIDEGNLFTLQSNDVFLRHQERQFLSEVGETPYYRLWATPIRVNQLNLRDRRMDMVQLLRSPPKLRGSGWDVTPIGNFRAAAIGLLCGRTDFHHLRLLWNGHLEFWTRADEVDFHWEEFNAKPPYRLLFPYAIIEAAECFVRLTSQMCQIAEYHGQLRFGLGLYHIEGQFLLPGEPDTFSSMRAWGMGAQPHGPQPFDSKHLIVAPIHVQAGDLPDTVGWRLVSQVYYRFGYTDDQIPLFDADHRCVLGQSSTEGGNP
jgi:hypothetical protein